MGEHDITFHELALGKEAQSPYALSFLVEFFHVHGSGEADAVDTTAYAAHHVKAPVGQKLVELVGREIGLQQLQATLVRHRSTSDRYERNGAPPELA